MLTTSAKTYLAIEFGHREDVRFCMAPRSSACKFPQSQSRATQRHDGQQRGELLSPPSSQELSHPGYPAAAIRSIISWACSKMMSGQHSNPTHSISDTCYHSDGLVRSDFDSEEARCNGGGGGGFLLEESFSETA